MATGAIPTALVLLALVSGAPASNGGDPIAGRALARHKCRECHDIGEKSDPGSVRSGPDWRKVAGERSKARIRAFLVGRHERMPRFALSRSEINDLVAYISSLKAAADRDRNINPPNGALIQPSAHH